MHAPYDELAKELGRKLLSPSGTTTFQAAFKPETQFADLLYEPDPARRPELAPPGLLGQLTDRTCIFEFYSGSVSSQEFRSCLTKHLVAWKQRSNNASADDKADKPSAPRTDLAMFLWIISADRPSKLLSELRLEPSPTDPGVYLFAGQVLRVGLVVASELPRKRETLLVRLIAGGREFGPASQELRALPADAYERVVAEQLLLECGRQLKKKPELTPAEKEFQMAILKCWEDSKAEGREEGRVEGREEGRVEGREEGRVEGRVEGREEGRTQTQAQNVLAVLHVRGIAVTDAIRERILGEHDFARLARWHKNAVVAPSISEVLEDPA